jgi:hypothetical protein
MTTNKLANAKVDADFTRADGHRLLAEILDSGKIVR